MKPETELRNLKREFKITREMLHQNNVVLGQKVVDQRREIEQLNEKLNTVIGDNVRLLEIARLATELAEERRK